jgi:hypothetical protein
MSSEQAKSPPHLEKGGYRYLCRTTCGSVLLARVLKDDGWPHPAELPASDLAAEHGPAFTSWADAFRPPTLAAVAGGSDVPAAKIAANVSLQSPLGLGGGNALGYAACCGRHD